MGATETFKLRNDSLVFLKAHSGCREEDRSEGDEAAAWVPTIHHVAVPASAAFHL